MSYDPTPTQALLLFGLLACQGECAQAELMPAVDKADREALEKATLIGVTKVGRALHFRLLDAGWDWAGAHLTAELPPPQRALHEMLARLDEHLAKTGETLAKFIGGKPEKKAGPKTKSVARPAAGKPARSKVSKPKAPPRPRATAAKPKAAVKSEAPAKAAKSKPPSPTAVRKQIEKAYLSLTDGRKNESVRLAHLRAALPGLDRATVDASLGRILAGDKKASLMRHDDPNQLDRADHEAAFSPAGEPLHVIWIAT